MTQTVSEFIFVFMTAFLIAFLLIPLLNRMAGKLGFVSRKAKEKRVKSEIVISVSGLVIPVAFLAAILFGFFIEKKSFIQLFGSIKSFLGFLIGAFVILTVGILHDIKPLPKKIRFVFYILAALCSVTSGLTIFKIALPFAKDGYIALYSILGYIVTVLWILLLMFAVKIINRMEQYQSAIIASSFFATFIMGLLIQNYAVQFISVSMLGAFMGFMPYNLNKKMNIMGETGSVFTGYTLAVISIIGSIKGAVTAGIVVPYILIGFPVFEVVVYFIKKLFKIKNNTAPVLGSLYYRLNQKSYSENQVSVILIIIILVSSFSSFILLDKGRLACIIFAIVSIIVMALVFRYKSLLERKYKDVTLKESNDEK